MQLLIAAIADYANIAEGEKLNVMGVFDSINANAFPAKHPQLYIVLRALYEFEDSALAERRLEVVLADQDGNDALKATATIALPQIPAGSRIVMNHILSFRDLTFVSPNELVFLVRWNGQEIRRLPLQIRMADPAAP